VGPYTDFKGTLKLDIRDSKADWGPFTPKKAPASAPNILFILYDDTGLSAWSPYGGRVNMPTLQRLADQRRRTMRLNWKQRERWRKTKGLHP
jgi:hypothetical protein